jgi:FkbM family methyltransferase
MVITAGQPQQILQQALQLHQAGRLAQAQQGYQQVLSLDPRNIDALHLLGLVCHQQGDHKQAVKFITKAIKRNAKSPEMHNNLGEAYREQGKLDLAIGCYQRAIHLNKSYAQAHNNLGICFSKQTKNSQAVKNFSRALELNPSYCEAHYNFGCYLLKQKEFHKALEHLSAARRISASFSPVYIPLGHVFNELGQFEPALECYQLALASNPLNTEVLQKTGETLMVLQRHKEAIEYFQKVVSRRWKSPDAHKNLGKAQFADGLIEAASDSFEMAIKFDENCVEAYRFLLKLNKNTAQQGTEENNNVQPHHFNKLKQCRHGMMLFNRHDVFIGRSLDYYGEFSEGESQLFNRLINAGDVIIEAGANIGSHTLHLAKAAGDTGFVYAYEPQRFVFQTLCANLALNGITNVKAINGGVSSQPGIMRVPLLDPEQSENFGAISLNTEPVGEEVSLYTIDGLNLSCCRLIKVDVEGMELDVIMGAKETITKLRPILYLENDRPEKSDALLSQVKSLGYKIWQHLPPLFNPENFRQKEDDIFNGIVSGNILCVSNEQDMPLNLDEWGMKEI